MKKHHNRKRTISQQTSILGIIVVLIIIISIYFAYTILIEQDSSNNDGQLSGYIEIDGSSTVFPISEAVAEEFSKIFPNVRVNVGVSGTGGGFKRFTIGDIDINDASRPIKNSENEIAVKNNVDYTEIKVAIDGLAIVVNPLNTWVDLFTLDELKRIWEPESKVSRWSEIRSEWPDENINLYGPGTDSGTFDYFTKVIVGEEGASRADYTASEDDNVLIQGISGDPNSLGYFGFAFYSQNKDILKIVPIDSGNGPVTPSDETIQTNTYKPLSRPLFIYVNLQSLERSEIKEFVKFYLENAPQLVIEVGYTSYSLEIYDEMVKQISSLGD